MFATFPCADCLNTPTQVEVEKLQAVGHFGNRLLSIGYFVKPEENIFEGGTLLIA